MTNADNCGYYLENKRMDTFIKGNEIRVHRFMKFEYNYLFK